MCSRAPTLVDGRVLCLDGPAGTGKTTLAADVAAIAGAAQVVHLDDLYGGWSGLPRVGDRLASLLAPLVEGRPGRYRRWDWHASAWAEHVEVTPGGLLVLEGVGSWAPAHAPLVTALVWLDAAAAVRRARVVARDGAAVTPYLTRWQADEAAHHARLGTRDAADLRLGSAVEEGA